MAIDAGAIMQPMRFTLDVESGLVMRPQRTALMKGDRRANRIIVELTKGGAPFDATGAQASGSFISPMDGAEIPLEGEVSGSEIGVTLIDECYAADGYYEASVKLTLGDTARTILTISGQVMSKGSGAVIDVGDVIPSIDDVIAQYAAMKTAVESANSAADAANAAAGRAPYIGDNGNWYVWSSTSNAYTDTGTAATGPQGEKGATGATGAQGPQGERGATGATGATGPAGADGDTPYIGSNGNWWIGDTDTGTAAQGPAGANGEGSGTVTGVKVSGTTYEPDESGVVDLGEIGGTGVPDGGTTGQMLFKTSDEDGAAEWQTPTAQKVGALPSDGTAVNAGKLGGLTIAELILKPYPIGSIYMSMSETSPASLFGGTWEQIKDTFLLGAGDSYTLGSTGGEAEVLIDKINLPSRAVISYHNNTGEDLFISTAGWSAETIEPDKYIATTVQDASAEGIIESCNEALNNMPPYLAVYMWKRTA